MSVGVTVGWATVEASRGGAATSDAPLLTAASASTIPLPTNGSHALGGRCETLDGDGRRDDSHCAQVHDPDDQEDGHQIGTAGAAAEAEAQAVSPGRGGVRRQCTASPRRLPAAGKAMRLPRAELERAGDQDGHAGRDRYGARQRRLLHLDLRKRSAQWKDGHPEHRPDEEVSHAHERRQRAQARLAPPPAGPVPWAPSRASATSRSSDTIHRHVSGSVVTTGSGQ